MTAGDLARLSPDGRVRLDDGLGRAEEALLAMGVEGHARRLFVPGRIEVLGKHTDYAGGRSLTCAVERGFAVCYRPRADALVRVVDARDGRRVDFPLDADVRPQVGHWSNYPMTVARRLARNFPGIDAGADIAFYSNLPKAAGLSTSSALVTAVYLVLAEVNALERRPDFRTAVPTRYALAGYLGSIENGQAFGALTGDHGVGTSGGSEDHTAILLSDAARLGWFRYHPVERVASVPLPPDLVFVVAASGIAADKTGSARSRYNRASTLVSAILSMWQRETGRQDVTLAAALDAAPDALPTLRRLVAERPDPVFSPGDLSSRLEHFIVEERQLLPAAVAAFEGTHLGALGALVERSQRAAEDLLGNQVPETVDLAREARDLGAYAASAFGAGFGGSVWALVDATAAEGFLCEWSETYGRAHPAAAARATFFITPPGPGAMQIQR